MRRIIGIIMACLGLLVTAVLAAGPASAHTYTSQQGSDVAQATHGYTCPSNGNCYYRQAIVDDNECDNHKVWIFYHVNGGSQTYQFSDTDGCGGTRTALTLGSGYNITSFRVAEENGPGGGYTTGPLVTTSVHAPV